MTEITQTYVRERLRYDPDTGDFSWIAKRGTDAATRRWNSTHAGKVAGHVSKTLGYATIRLDGKLLFSHRLAVLYMLGFMPLDQVDHKDKDRGNNAWNNLRICTKAQNMHNIPKLSNNTSGYKGVSWHRKRKKWAVSIRTNGRKQYLGIFDKIEEAAEAYRNAAIEQHGSFARFE